MTTLTNHLHSLTFPAIAAIDGYAMGGGAELTTAVNRVMVSHNADIRAHGWGGARRLVVKVVQNQSVQSYVSYRRQMGMEM